MPVPASARKALRWLKKSGQFVDRPDSRAIVIPPISRSFATPRDREVVRMKNTRSQAAKKAWQTRRRPLSPRQKAHIAEVASKEALREYCKKHGWRVAFFEGPTGAPRTGIIDAIVFRVDRRNPDRLDLRLIQLKGGEAGVSGREIARLKHAANDVTVHWTIAMYDGKVLHLLPDL
jgi:hypothetical protein